jgi:hypothetical protein
MSPAASCSASSSGLWLAALTAAALAGFWRPYLSRIATGVDVLTHVHAGTMMGWMLLLSGQALLIRHRRRRAHRILGLTSYAFMPAVLGAALALAVHRVCRAGADVTIERAELFFVQLGTTALLAAFYVLAIVHRRNPPVHARYMIGTGLTMIDPIAARVLIHLIPSWAFLSPYVVWVVTLPVLVVLIAREDSGPRARTPFAHQLALFALYQAAVPLVGRSGPWLRAVEWLAT